MKKSILSLLLLLGFSMSVCAQKIVLIDTEYILRMCLHIRKATSQIEAEALRNGRPKLRLSLKKQRRCILITKLGDASYRCSEDNSRECYCC
jgi:hypothetical protein